MSVGQKRALQITAGFLFASGIADLATSFFPWNPDDSLGTLANIIHGILVGGVAVPSFLLSIGFGVRAGGRWFRFYSYGTLLILIVSGAVMVFLGDPRIEANLLETILPPAWFGLTERIVGFGFMLWMLVFTVVLTRNQPESLDRED